MVGRQQVVQCSLGKAQGLQVAPAASRKMSEGRGEGEQEGSCGMLVWACTSLLMTARAHQPV